MNADSDSDSSNSSEDIYSKTFRRNDSDSVISDSDATKDGGSTSKDVDDVADLLKNISITETTNGDRIVKSPSEEDLYTSIFKEHGDQTLSDVENIENPENATENNESSDLNQTETSSLEKNVEDIEIPIEILNKNDKKPIYKSALSNGEQNIELENNLSNDKIIRNKSDDISDGSDQNYDSSSKDTDDVRNLLKSASLKETTNRDEVVKSSSEEGSNFTKNEDQRLSDAKENDQTNEIKAINEINEKSIENIEKPENATENNESSDLNQIKTSSLEKNAEDIEIPIEILNKNDTKSIDKSALSNDEQNLELENNLSNDKIIGNKRENISDGSGQDAKQKERRKLNQSKNNESENFPKGSQM